MLSTKRARRDNKSRCAKRQQVAESVPTNGGSRSETSGNSSVDLLRTPRGGVAVVDVDDVCRRLSHVRVGVQTEDSLPVSGATVIPAHSPRTRQRGTLDAV